MGRQKIQIGQIRGIWRVHEGSRWVVVSKSAFGRLIGRHQQPAFSSELFCCLKLEISGKHVMFGFIDFSLEKSTFPRSYQWKKLRSASGHKEITEYLISSSLPSQEFAKITKIMQRRKEEQSGSGEFCNLEPVSSTGMLMGSCADRAISLPAPCGWLRRTMAWWRDKPERISNPIIDFPRRQTCQLLREKIFDTFTGSKSASRLPDRSIRPYWSFELP